MSRYSFLVSNLCFELKIYCIFFSHAHHILVDLEIDNNQLGGSIPTEIGTLKSLEKLNLGEFITECGECKKIL